MRPSRKVRATITFVALGLSIVAWVMLLFNPGHNVTIQHCHVSGVGPSADTFRMLLEMNPISSQLTGWGFMVIAMMLPKLIIPIQHIYATSLRRLRLPLAMLFILGYLVVWVAIGPVIILLSLWMQILTRDSFIPLIVAVIIAIVWQFSPLKQRCLNEGHSHWILPSFGWRPYRDALLFGIVHGAWCVGSGWAIMLLPMLFLNGHNLMMLAATYIMLSEHLEHPQRPRWHVFMPMKLFRIVVAQTHIKLGT
jgi:predicted metal-binding membrane protein